MLAGSLLCPAGVKAKREKLFGFGHRVYKNFDPRAKIIRGVAEDVFKIAGRDPLIEVAIALQVSGRLGGCFTYFLFLWLCYAGLL